MSQDPAASLSGIVTRLTATFVDVSDRIWDFAETRFDEVRSAALQAETLEKLGFAVTRDVAGMATAFVAEKGSDGPVIAFLGEFDALANMSQAADVAAPSVPVPGGNGHGCGHNLLGAGAMLAAASLAETVAQMGLAARIRYYGCPAEEGGAGKAFMVRAGLFDDVDLAFTWHPAPFCGVRSTENLAVAGMNYRFFGKSAHASNAPHLGRSALDALELMNIGVNFLREHIPSDCRVHYAITDAGGSAPNVVQSTAAAHYYIRSPRLSDLPDLIARVDRIAAGAAMMTDTTTENEFVSASANLIPSHTLENALHQSILAIGPVPFDKADFDFAQKIRETLTPEMVESSLRLYNVKGDAVLNRIGTETVLHNGILAFDGTTHFRAGSTDVGDVSWVVPTAQIWMPVWAVGTPVHSWQVVAQGKSAGAHKSMTHAGHAMARAGLEAILNPGLIAAAKAELADRKGGHAYKTLIPETVLPPRPGQAAH